MPELPEVEAITRLLAARAVGRPVARVDVAAISVLKTYDPPVTALGGLWVGGVARHGKFLDLTIGSGAGDPDSLHLVVHLARAGWLQWRDTLPAAPPRPGKGPLALRVHLGPRGDGTNGDGPDADGPDADGPDADGPDADGPGGDGSDGGGFDLTEAGTKKGLAVYCVRRVLDVPGIARLGPDPLSDQFDAPTWAGILAAAGRAQIKGVLRDQAVIAGIGNAYSDEVLHAAGLSPFKPASSLTETEVARLFATIRATLADAIDRSAGLATGALKGQKKAGLRVHGRAGQPCPVCSDTVREVSFADSALQYCPTCQTGGRPLADRRMSRLLR